MRRYRQQSRCVEHRLRSPTCPTTQLKNLRETVLMGLSMVVGVAAGVPADQSNRSNGCLARYCPPGKGTYARVRTVLPPEHMNLPRLRCRYLA